MEKLFKIILTIFLLFTFPFSFSVAESVKRNKADRFFVQNIGDGKYKVVIDMRGEKDINSYVISVDGYNSLGEAIVADKNMISSNGLYYLASSDNLSSTGNLFKDNGLHDEDSRLGVFQLTVDSKKWPNGRFIVKVSATNRPSPGRYYSIKNLFVVDRNVNFRVNKAIIENFEIWKHPTLNAYFPTLKLLDNGVLMLKFSTRINQSHIDTTGGKEYLLSTNGGTSWTSSSLHRDSSFAKLNKFNRKVVVDIHGWDFSRINPQEKMLSVSREAVSSNDIMISTYFPNNKLEKRVKFNTPRDVLDLLRFDEIYTKNGGRLISMYGNRLLNGKHDSQVYFLRSTDEGKTWEFVYLIPKECSIKAPPLTETAIVELKNKTILAMSRGDKGLYQSVSRDNGNTWSCPLFTGIKGYPASLLALDDGRIVCFYGYRHNPMGIRAAISYDDGNSWDLESEIVIRNDGVDFDGTNIGYPKAVQLQDGKILVVYYIRTDNNPPFIAGSLLEL